MKTIYIRNPNNSCYEPCIQTHDDSYIQLALEQLNATKSRYFITELTGDGYERITAHKIGTSTNEEEAYE